MEKVETSETKRINLAISDDLMTQMNDWRRQQPDVPNASETIRRLIELGLRKKLR